MQKSPHLLAGTEIYRPLCTELQQIRLLTILPGSGDDELRCHLRTASLDYELWRPYETISYAWGDRDLRANIIVNNSVLNVPRSSKDALSWIRSKDDERVVWIDSICINQNDISERGAQVSMMATIYMKGDQNLIFLGSDEENVAETAIAALDQTFRCVAQHIMGLSSMVQSELRGRHVPDDWDLDLDLAEQDFALYEKLYGLPWFRRLWVVIEAAVAVNSTCYWGSVQFPLGQALLVGAVLPKARCSYGRLHFIDDLQRAADINTLESFTWRPRFFQDLPLLFFTQILKRFSTSELRDRVFAAVQLYLRWNGMREIPSLLVSDYTKSVADVYRDASRFMFSRQDYLHGLDLAMVEHWSLEDLEVEKSGFTSWTIRFDRGFDREFNAMPFDFRFHAGFKKNTTQAVRIPESLSGQDANLLILKALLIDTVTTTTRYSVRIEDVPELAESIVETLRSWAKQTVVAEVLTAGRLGAPGFEFKTPSKMLKGYRAFCKLLLSWDRSAPPVMFFHDSARSKRYATWFADLFEYAAGNRRFFRTRNSWLGCGPKVMRAGDVVFVMEGARHACILRPVDGTDHWLFVGEAYVHGLMHGEIFERNVTKWARVKKWFRRETLPEQEELEWEYVKLR